MRKLVFIRRELRKMIRATICTAARLVPRGGALKKLAARKLDTPLDDLLWYGHYHVTTSEGAAKVAAITIGKPWTP